MLAGADRGDLQAGSARFRILELRPVGEAGERSACP
jgi:hypothetical protein